MECIFDSDFLKHDVHSPSPHSYFTSCKRSGTNILKYLTVLKDELKMYFFPKTAKRASKMIVPLKEMLLSFSIVTFFTNYDVLKRKFL